MVRNALLQDLEKYSQKRMGLINAEITLAAKKLRAGRYDLILAYPGTMVIAYDERLDVTEEALKLLNEQYRDGRPYKKEIEKARAAAVARSAATATGEPEPTERPEEPEATGNPEPSERPEEPEQETENEKET